MSTTSHVHSALSTYTLGLVPMDRCRCGHQRPHFTGAVWIPNDVRLPNAARAQWDAWLQTSAGKAWAAEVGYDRDDRVVAAPLGSA